MKIAIVCPASLPATQFGGIVFLAVDLAREISEIGHDVTIYTTDLDFSNGPNKFNRNLPSLEKFEKFKINRTHVWFSLKLFFINTSMLEQIEKDKFEQLLEEEDKKNLEIIKEKQQLEENKINALYELERTKMTQEEIAAENKLLDLDRMKVTPLTK